MWFHHKTFLTVLLLAFSAPLAQAEIKVGDVFPPFTLPGVNGIVPATAGRVVLVDFWASWCAPCKESFPAIAKLHADYAAKGLIIIAVGIDEKPAAYQSFLKKMAPPFTTLHDSQQALVREVKVPKMPSSYLIGRDGQVRMLHGWFDIEETGRELRREIETLLAEKN